MIKHSSFKAHTESLQDLLVRHFGLLPLPISVAIHCVGGILWLDLRLRWSRHLFHQAGRLCWFQDRTCVDLHDQT